MSYGKVFETFWTDEKVERFSDDAKLMALYLLTGPHRSMIGCMRLPDGYVTSDLRWTKDRVAKAFLELAGAGFAFRDPSGWTLICNQLKYDPPASPNHGRAALKALASIPDGTIRQKLLPKLIAALTDLGETFASPCAALRKELRTPEPEPEPEPEQEPEHTPDVCALAVGLWNDLAKDTGLTSVQVLSEQRRGALRKRLEECGGLDGWAAALAKVRDSPFLRGEIGKDGWKADFDFLLRKSKFIKIMEGGYDGNRNNFNNGFAQLASQGGAESL
jgi:hypothetical protein